MHYPCKQSPSEQTNHLSLSQSLSLSLSLSFSLLSLSFDFRIGINLIKIDIYFLGPHGAPTNTLKKKKFKFEVYSLLFCFVYERNQAVSSLFMIKLLEPFPPTDKAHKKFYALHNILASQRQCLARSLVLLLPMQSWPPRYLCRCSCPASAPQLGRESSQLERRGKHCQHWQTTSFLEHTVVSWKTGVIRNTM